MVINFAALLEGEEAFVRDDIEALTNYERALRIVKHGAPISVIHELPVVDTLIRMKTTVPNEELGKLDEIQKAIDEQMSRLDSEYR